MRISDWSSDVCSSDLRSSRSRILTPSAAVFRLWIKIVEQSRGAALGGDVEMQEYGPSGEPAGSARPVFLGIRDRKSVVSGKIVSVRVDRCGSCFFKNKQYQCTKRTI